MAEIFGEKHDDVASEQELQQVGTHRANLIFSVNEVGNPKKDLGYNKYRYPAKGEEL